MTDTTNDDLNDPSTNTFLDRVMPHLPEELSDEVIESFAAGTMLAEHVGDDPIATGTGIVFAFGVVAGALLSSSGIELTAAERSEIEERHATLLRWVDALITKGERK